MTGGLLSTVPPHAEGFVDIVVANLDGQTATSPGFHDGPPPVISVTRIAFATPKLDAGWHPFAVTSFDGQYATSPGYLVYPSGS